MSWGHVTATHHRSDYADPGSCSYCREQYQDRHGVSYERVVQRQGEVLRSIVSLGGLVVVLFLVLRAVLWFGEWVLRLAF